MSSMMDVDDSPVKKESGLQPRAKQDQQRQNLNSSPFMIEAEDVKGVEDDDDDDTMDMNHLDRKVWLVKVPKFLADKWLNVEEADVELGRLRVVYDSKDPKKKDMVLHLEDSDERYQDIPKQYNMSISKTDGLKNEFVFSENENGTAKAFEGTVIVESKIAPIVNEDYHKIMRARTEMAQAKERSRTVKLIDDRSEKQVFMLQSSGTTSLASRSRIELVSFVFLLIIYISIFQPNLTIIA
jgi:transcription initiation factor TFIIF subunit beta